MAAPRLLVIACGALARELLAITQWYGMDNVTVECLPASLHNRPSEIPELVRARIRRARDGGAVPLATDGTGDMSDAELVERGTDGADGRFDRILIGYADCGTGGLLAEVCREEGVEMLAGAHCYQFFANHERFEELQDHEVGSFYLTDFLARNWERLIWHGLGLDRHPELLEMYFGNYTRCVYLAQADDPKALAAAHACAAQLGLDLHVEPTGYGELESTVVEFTRRAATA